MKPIISCYSFSQKSFQLTCLFALVLLLVTPAGAAILLQHHGSADPGAEGWERGDNGSPTTLVSAGPIDDGGVAAWAIRDTGTSEPSVLGYSARFTPAQVEELNQQGWTLHARIRVPEISAREGSQGLYVNMPIRQFWMFFTMQNGNLAAMLSTNATGFDHTGIAVPVPAPVDGYHDYELRYEPSSQSVTFLIDGVARVTDYTGRLTPSSVPLAGFGAGNSLYTGIAHYARVDFRSGRGGADCTFAYQGRLNDGPNPASGFYDLQFSLHDAATGGRQIGEIATFNDVAVGAGAFQVLLNFGEVFDGQPRWIEVSVRRGAETGPFTTLLPRQPIRPVPVACYAEKAGTVADGAAVKSLNGLTADVQLRAGANVTLTPSGNVIEIASTGAGTPGPQGPPGPAGPPGPPGTQVELSGSGTALTAARSDHDHLSALWSGDAAVGLGIENSREDGLGIRGVAPRGIGLVGASDNQIGVLAEAPRGTAIVARGNRILAGQDSNGIETMLIEANGDITTAGRFIGDGSGLTRLNASAIQGRLPEDGLPEALRGFSVGSFAVAGETTLGTAIYGSNGNSDTDGHAGYFNGRVTVTGVLTAERGFSGDGSRLTRLSASALEGLIPATSLPESWRGFSASGFAIAGETSTGTAIYGSNGNSDAEGHAGYFNGRVTSTGTITAQRGFFGDGFGLARLNGAALEGRIPGSSLPESLTGFSASGFAIAGETTSGSGIYGSNGNSDSAGHAGYFNGRVRVTQSLRADTGVSAFSGSGFALSGTVSGDGTGVFGSNNGSETVGHAGYFFGRTRVTGSLTVGGMLNADGGLTTPMFNANNISVSSLTANTVSSTSASGFGLAGYTTEGTAIYGDNGNSDTIGHAAFFSGRVRITQGLTVDGTLRANVDASSLTSGVVPGARIPSTITRSGADVGFEVTINEPTTVSTALSGKIFGNLPQNNNSYGVYGDGGTYGVGVRGDSWFETGVYARSNSGIALNAVSPQGSCIYAGPVYGDPRFIVSNLGVVSGREFRTTSDRNAKQGFQDIDPLAMLERVASLPIQSWSYKDNPDVRHIGPVAQDFKAAFGVGEDEKRITTVDADGVALAAIQGLNRKLENEVREKDARIQTLEERITALEQFIRNLRTANQ